MLAFCVRHHVVVKGAILYLVAEVEDFELILSCSLVVCRHLVVDSCHVLCSVLHAHLLWEVRTTELISHVGHHLRSHVRSRIWERERRLSHVLRQSARGICVGSGQRVLHVDGLQLLQRLDLSTELIDALLEWSLRSVRVARE